MLQIFLKFNNRVLKTIESDKNEIMIGRSIENDIIIENLAVSKLHARIVKQDGRHSIEDLNSTNGTYLNEEKIIKEDLKNNDNITIGKHTLEIHIGGKESIGTAQYIKDDTMKLTTEKHIEMLEKQKKRNNTKQV